MHDGGTQMKWVTIVIDKVDNTERVNLNNYFVNTSILTHPKTILNT